MFANRRDANVRKNPHPKQRKTENSTRRKRAPGKVTEHLNERVAEFIQEALLWIQRFLNQDVLRFATRNSDRNIFDIEGGRISRFFVFTRPEIEGVPFRLRVQRRRSRLQPLRRAEDDRKDPSHGTRGHDLPAPKEESDL